MAALGVFGLCQILGFANYLRSKISEDAFNLLLRRVVMVVGGLAVAVATVLSLTGKHWEIKGLRGLAVAVPHGDTLLSLTECL